MVPALRRARITRFLSVGLCAAPVLSACSGAALDGDFAREREAVVYGADDRREIAEDPSWQRVFDDSVVALIPGNRLRAAGDGKVEVFSMTLAEKYSVCADARFASQPTAAACAGVLIASDLVLTAGHCFLEEPRCDQYAYVAGYAEVDGNVTLDGTNVYGCRDLLVRRVDVVPGSRHIDFAVVRLDRPASLRPATVELAAPAVGQALTMLGFPNGLPGKLDSGGRVTENAASEHFQADVDAFAASSGSPVFDEAKVLRGLLVAGAPFDYEAGLGCWNVREVPADEAESNGTERVALPRLALEALRDADDLPERPARCTGLDCTAHALDEFQVLSPPAGTSDTEDLPGPPPAQSEDEPSTSDGRAELAAPDESAPGAGCSLAAPGRDAPFGAIFGVLGIAAGRRRGRRR